MNWIKIDTNKLPENEVLAANFIPGTYGYKEKLVGYIGQVDEILICNGDGTSLENCSHFVEIHNTDIYPIL